MLQIFAEQEGAAAGRAESTRSAQLDRPRIEARHHDRTNADIIDPNEARDA